MSWVTADGRSRTHLRLPVQRLLVMAGNAMWERSRRFVALLGGDGSASGLPGTPPAQVVAPGSAPERTDGGWYAVRTGGVERRAPTGYSHQLAKMAEAPGGGTAGQQTARAAPRVEVADLGMAASLTTRDTASSADASPVLALIAGVYDRRTERAVRTVQPIQATANQMEMPQQTLHHATHAGELSAGRRGWFRMLPETDPTASINQTLLTSSASAAAPAQVHHFRNDPAAPRLFDGCPVSAWAELVNSAQPETCSPGRAALRIGEPAPALMSEAHLRELLARILQTDGLRHGLELKER